MEKLHQQQMGIAGNESREAAKLVQYIKLLNEDQMNQRVKQTDNIFISFPFQLKYPTIKSNK